MAVPEKPQTNKEKYYAAIAGLETDKPEDPITREEQYLERILEEGLGNKVEANPDEIASESLKKIKIDDTVFSIPNGGSGGTSDYTDLDNKPEINGVTLAGDKSASDLGLVAAEQGKGLSTNDYTDEDAEIVAGVTAALGGKQDTLTIDEDGFINL